MSLRLDRFISNQTGLSRSDAREKLKSKCVLVNDVPENRFDRKINPETDTVCIDGKTVEYSEYIYVIMNKPKGVLTATHDKSASTVLDLVPENLRRKNLAPVGRLDKDTTGLLILTDDGVFAHKVISPGSCIEKEYAVLLDGEVTEDMIKMFAEGIVLADGTLCKPAVLIKDGKNAARIIISEGKYHQIKRMLGVVGLGVEELKRVRIGNIMLPEDLPEGGIISIGEKFHKM